MFKELEDRIAKLESMLKIQPRTQQTAIQSSTKKSNTQETIVGNLIFTGNYVKTGTAFMSSKTRYAIGKSITENYGGTKLSKGNAFYDDAHKLDKYVQVYEFKTKADCKKFMQDQQKRLSK